jgi:hypothetical protein
MKLTFACAVFSISLAVAYGAQKANKPTPHPIIGTSYYCCDKCLSLEGGMWGKTAKGTLKKYSGSYKKECIHEWREISKEEFKSLATKYYSVDWSKEHWFWRAKKKGENKAGT